MSFDSIVADIKNNDFKSIYLLHGEEPLFIDKLVNKFIESFPKDAADFDLSILYGADTKSNQLVNTVKRYPMIAKKHMIVIREAQLMRNIADILPIIIDPIQTSVFVIANSGKIDMRKKWVKEVKKVGSIFSSTKINDWDMSKWIASECKSKGLTIDQKSAEMLFEFLGNDLSRIVGDIDKLGLLTGPEKRITPELIEKNIGISRDYNIFELQDALLKRDQLKLNRIVKHYGENTKDHPLPMVTASLYSFFTKLILIHAHKAFDPGSAAKVLRVKPFYAGKLITGARNFSYGKLVQNISTLCTYDLKAKGVDSYDEDPGELMKEMFFKLTH